MKKTLSLIIAVFVFITASLSISVTIYAAYLKPPIIQTAQNRTEGIKLTWNSVYGATGYRVYRVYKGENWTFLGTTSKTSFTDKTAENGKLYRYTLRATDGKTRGDYDREGKLMRRLETPGSFTATNKTDGVEVKWASVKNAKTYRVYRRFPGESWQLIKIVNTNSYLDKAPQSGKNYSYTVKAVNGEYMSHYSADGVSIKRLSNPTNMKTANRSDGVFLTWSGVSGATKYRVYRRGSGESWQLLKVVSNKYYLDKTAKKNTTYRYTVRAADGSTQSYFYSDGPVIKFSTPVFKSVINTTSAESYSSINSKLKKLQALYPDKITITSMGKSEAGNNIPMITLGKGEKRALIVGAIHAREHITTKYLLRCIEDYCFASTTASGKLGSYNIRKLLNEYTLYIVPCTNPDGLEIIRSRLKPKSHTVKDLSEYKANYNGVDLNRNFPLAWEQINNGVKKPADYYFKGYKSGDQKETKALMKLCENNDFQFMLSIHIKGNCLYWGDNYNKKYNSQYKAFAKDIADACGFYMPQPTKEASSYGGGFENWFRHTYNRPGVCVELSHVNNIIKPCDNSNYKDFNSFVNYKYSKYAIAAAMTSDNKN